MKYDYSVGRVFTGNFGNYKIIEYKNAREVTVEFEDGYTRKCSSNSLRIGSVKNPNFPTIFGVGYLGEGKFSDAKGFSESYTYKLWRHVLGRVFRKEYEAHYSDCDIDELWLCYNNFAEWCHNQKGFSSFDDKGERFQLDKDFKLKGNRLYSPETCIFLPREINQSIVSRRNYRGKNPLGVVKSKSGSFHSNVLVNGVREFGKAFTDAELAFQEYKHKKESNIRRLADKYRAELGEDNYKILLNYEVSIDD